MSALSEAVERLASARATEAHEKEALATVEAVVQEKFGKALTKARLCLQTARTEETDASADVRRLSVEKHEGGREAELHPAATIIMATVLYYDGAKAIDHCRKHLPGALSLKKRDFEKVAKVANLDFVKIRKESRVRIARDLSEWLPGEEDDDATAT